jgi:ribosomal protein S18 acetylase RimI-like enzyme
MAARRRGEAVKARIWEMAVSIIWAKKMTIQEMTIADYGQVAALWQNAEGVLLRDDVDSEAGIAIYLQRNPRMSFVARDGRKVIGAVLCGHDGRMGFLYHLVVEQSYRGKGVGRMLVEKAAAKLSQLGMSKCFTFVYADNPAGQQFWERIGWSVRTDLKGMSKDIG